MKNRQKKLNLYKGFGAFLIDKGKRMLAMAFNVKITHIVKRAELQNFLRGLGLTNNILADEKYYLTDWETWKQIMKYDWIDKKKYLVDRYDCDNFSGSFHSTMAEIYGLNSVGDAKSIDIKDANTDKHLNYHRANIIITYDTELKAYAYEPQTDRAIQITAPTAVLGGWKYYFNILEFN